MRDRNTLGKGAFIGEHIFWAALTWIWYKKLLFRCIPSRSLSLSRMVLLASVVLFCLIGIAFQIRRRRNSIEVFFNLALGYGAYAILTYWDIHKRLIVTCLVAAAILSAAYALRILGRKIAPGKPRAVILRRRAGQVAAISKKCVGLGLTAVLAVTGVGVLFGSSLVKSDVRPATNSNLSEQTIANNIETVVLLRDSDWETLSVKARLDVLQTIANIEQRYLGLPHELNVGAANLDEGTLGYYSDPTHEIIISMESLLYDSSLDVLDTLCHEAYHSYQHRLVDAMRGVDEAEQSLMVFRKAQTYADEFSDYENGEADFCSYFEQDCESDARDYASSAVIDYCRHIISYLEGA